MSYLITWITTPFLSIEPQHAAACMQLLSSNSTCYPVCCSNQHQTDHACIMCRPPDALLRQLQRYAWLPVLCEAVMCLKDCCSTQQMAGSTDHAAAEAMQHADTAILALGR
jgi:hypothetical protein